MRAAQSHITIAPRAQVRLCALPRVQLWSFGEADQPPSFCPLASLASPFVDPPSLPTRHFRHQAFPRDFFPEYPDWSRKGFLFSRWKLGDVRHPTLRFPPHPSSRPPIPNPPPRRAVGLHRVATNPFTPPHSPAPTLPLGLHRAATDPF